MGGTERNLSAIVKDGRSWVAVGQVTEVESHASLGFLATVALRPSGREVQARIVSWGAGAGAGIFWPVAVDDEVLVLFPGGDPNRAVALPGLPSESALPPDGWDNAKILVEGVDRDVEVATGQDASRATLKITASSGEVVVTSSSIRLGSSSATDFVALASLVTTQLETLKAAIDGAAVSGGDGGATFKANLIAALTAWPASVAASKTRSE